jgi:hypothetical protein
MTRTNPKPAIASVKDLLLADPDSLREVVRAGDAGDALKPR